MSNPNYADQALRMLRDAGLRGVPNYELAKIALQYNSNCIFVLRKRGYDIRKRKVSKGTYEYYIHSEPATADLHKQKIDEAAKAIGEKRAEAGDNFFGVPEQTTLVDVPVKPPVRPRFV